MTYADCSPGREPRSVAASCCVLLRYIHIQVQPMHNVSGAVRRVYVSRCCVRRRCTTCPVQCVVCVRVSCWCVLRRCTTCPVQCAVCTCVMLVRTQAMHNVSGALRRVYVCCAHVYAGDAQRVRCTAPCVRVSCWCVLRRCTTCPVQCVVCTCVVLVCTQAMHNVSGASRRSADEQLQCLQLAVEQRKISFRQAGSVSLTTPSLSTLLTTSCRV